MRKAFLIAAVVLIALSSLSAGKQKIIVRLREPLKAEVVKVRLPEVKNARGETRDLETSLQLGVKPPQEAPKAVEAVLKLNMAVRSLGKNAVQVTLTLPTPGFVELLVLDFYGKQLATLFDGQLPPGVYPLKPYTVKGGDNNAIKFVTLRINGKVVMKRMMTRVR